MKIETITQTIEFTIEESSVTICRRRTIRSWSDQQPEAGHSSKVVEAAAKKLCDTSARDEENQNEIR